MDVGDTVYFPLKSGDKTQVVDGTLMDIIYPSRAAELEGANVLYTVRAQDTQISTPKVYKTEKEAEEAIK